MAYPRTGGELLCAVCIQYYGIVMVVPRAVGEAIRLRKGGSVDWAVVFVLAAPAVALAAQRSFIGGSWVYSGGRAWYVPILPALEYSYEDLLFRPPGVFGILAAALASCAALLGFSRECHRVQWHMPSTEMAVALATLWPTVIAYMIAILSIGHYTERYAIAIFTAYLVIIAWLAARFHGHWRRAAPVLLLALIVSILIAQTRALNRSYGKRLMPDSSSRTAETPMGRRSVRSQTPDEPYRHCVVADCSSWPFSISQQSPRR